MLTFGQLVEEGKATFKVNPINRAFGVIIFVDKMGEEAQQQTYTLLLNNKEYTLTTNKFNTNIKDVTLDTNQITEDQLKNAEVKIS